MTVEDQDWFRKGVDIWMIRDNLRLSYEDRVGQHQDTLDMIVALEQIRGQKHAKSSITSKRDLVTVMELEAIREEKRNLSGKKAPS